MKKVSCKTKAQKNKKDEIKNFLKNLKIFQKSSNKKIKEIESKNSNLKRD